MFSEINCITLSLAMLARYLNSRNLDSADERSDMGSPKILIFGERRKCCDLNSRASSLSQATYDEAVAIYHGVHDERREPKRFYKISRAERVGVKFPAYLCKSVRFVGHIFPLIALIHTDIPCFRANP